MNFGNFQQKTFNINFVNCEKNTIKIGDNVYESFFVVCLMMKFMMRHFYETRIVMCRVVGNVSISSGLLRENHRKRKISRTIAKGINLQSPIIIFSVKCIFLFLILNHK